VELLETRTGAPLRTVCDLLNQLMRYSGVLPLLVELGGGRLLDVGSGSAGIAPRLSSAWHVTAVDRTFDDYGTAPGPAAGNADETVLADASNLREA
jgi:hypothetical protein